MVTPVRPEAFYLRLGGHTSCSLSTRMKYLLALIFLSFAPAYAAQERIEQAPKKWVCEAEQTIQNPCYGVPARPYRKRMSFQVRICKEEPAANPGDLGDARSPVDAVSIEAFLTSKQLDPAQVSSCAAYLASNAPLGPNEKPFGRRPKYTTPGPEAKAKNPCYRTPARPYRSKEWFTYKDGKVTSWLECGKESTSPGELYSSLDEFLQFSGITANCGPTEVISAPPAPAPAPTMGQQIASFFNSINPWGSEPAPEKKTPPNPCAEKSAALGEGNLPEKAQASRDGAPARQAESQNARLENAIESAGAAL